MADSDRAVNADEQVTAAGALLQNFRSLFGDRDQRLHNDTGHHRDQDQTGGDVDHEHDDNGTAGKGEKERRVYFDAKAKLHLQDYLASRTDSNPALFVTLDAPHDRLKISGVEIRLRKLGRKLNMIKIHPHKFRNPNFNKIQTFY